MGRWWVILSEKRNHRMKSEAKGGFIVSTPLKNSCFFSGFADGLQAMMKPYDESCSLAGPPEPPEFS
jgi:hypothetical protein